MRIVFTLLLITLFLFPVFPVSAEPISVNFVTIDGLLSVQDQIKEYSTLIDVRSINSRERSKLEIQDALWINPHSGPAIENFLVTAEKEKTYIIFCSCPNDNYSIRTAQMLTKNGFQSVFVLKDGWDAISNSDMKIIQIRKED